MLLSSKSWLCSEPLSRRSDRVAQQVFPHGQDFSGCNITARDDQAHNLRQGEGRQIAPEAAASRRDLIPLTLPQVVGMVVADERLVLGLSRTRTRSKSSADCEMVPSPSLLRTLCCSVWHKCDLKGRTLLVTDFAVLVSTFSSEKSCQTVSECSSSGMLCQIMTSCVLLTCQGSTQANNAAFFQSRV